MAYQNYNKRKSNNKTQSDRMNNLKIPQLKSTEPNFLVKNFTRSSKKNYEWSPNCFIKRKEENTSKHVYESSISLTPKPDKEL